MEVKISGSNQQNPRKLSQVISVYGKLTVQIGCAESQLSSFLFVISFYGESLDRLGFVTVLSTIALQALLDRARGELPSDTRTLIWHWEIFRKNL